MVRSIYRSVYQALRKDITQGVYPFQTLLPTEAALCERFACSHSTVRRALGELAQDGYVQPRQGSGVTVIWQPEPHAAGGYATGGIETFTEVCAERGLTPETELIDFAETVIDEDLARTTGLAAGTPVTYMKRLRIADGTPVALEVTHTSRIEVPGITPEIARAGTYRYIEGTLGLKVLTSKRVIQMRAADADDIRYLRVPAASHVAVIDMQSFDSNGVMFEHIASHQTPDFFSVRIVATRKACPGAAV